MANDIFQAIADPTRREILSLIAKKPMKIGSVTERFNISRTAVYKHIKILAYYGLIRINKKGREHYCEADFSNLKEISDWIARYKMSGKRNKSKKRINKHTEVNYGC
jgi:DNA-binding transcriptional ArsR family regulator